MKRIVCCLFLILFLSPLCFAGSDISISNFEIISLRGEWRSGTLWAMGEIKNVGNVSGAPKIEIIARDSSGNLIDSAKFWPNSTDPIYPGRSCGIKHPITENNQAAKIEAQILSVSDW
ncbi:MAG: hypothetical protein U5L07_07835 [Desulfobacterales bacterium]|nr:hypothetical protein [Desulfobacterales bacterium]